MDSIYGLYYVDVDDQTKQYFYIGHTNDVERRFSEHLRDAKNQKFNKGKFMCDLLKAGLEICHEVLVTIPGGEVVDHYEAWYVIKYIRDGYTLENMKQGDAKQKALVDAYVNKLEIQSVLDYKKSREAEKLLNDAQKALRDEDRSLRLSVKVQKNQLQELLVETAKVQELLNSAVDAQELLDDYDRQVGILDDMLFQLDMKITGAKDALKNQKYIQKCLLDLFDNRDKWAIEPFVTHDCSATYKRASDGVLSLLFGPKNISIRVKGDTKVFKCPTNYFRSMVGSITKSFTVDNYGIGLLATQVKEKRGEL